MLMSRRILVPLETRLDSILARRLVWNVLPASLVVGAVYVTVVGKEGLLARHALKMRVSTTEQAVRELEVANAHKRLEIAALRRDPAALTRVAADELFLAPAGSTIYRFDEPE